MTHQLTNRVLQLGAGSVGAPSLHFGDATTGIYRPAANQIGLSISGTQRILFNSSGIEVSGTYLQATNSGGSASFRCYTYRDSTTQSSYNLYNARGTLASPANLQSGDANGTLTVWAWQSGTTFVNNGLIGFRTTEAHSSTALGCECRIFTTPNASTTPAVAFTIGQNKSARIVGGLGVFDATPVTSKPAVTGSRGGNAALASLLTTLAGYGLITDSTT